MGYVIGVDPGKNNTGICCLAYSDCLCEVLKVNVRSCPKDQSVESAAFLQAESVHGFINWMSSQYPVIASNTIIVVEIPVCYPNSPKRASDQMDLMRIAGNIEGRVNHIWRTIGVKPADWKGQVPKKVHNARTLEELPGLAYHLSDFKKSKHEHIIDAAGIALWYLKGGRCA